MALKEKDRIRLSESPDLINFNRVLALFAYNAVAFVGAGKTVDDINERAKYAAELTAKASEDLSTDCGPGCYWDEEQSCCVCSGRSKAGSAIKAPATAKSKRSTVRKETKSLKRK